MYHKISENPAEHNAFCISPKDFEEDIRYLKENGYHFCTASELTKYPKWEKCVFITFDDGYDSDYHYALPVLEKYNAKATFFIIGSTVGKEDHITKEHLVKLSKSPLVEIGAHSFALHNMSLESIKAEFYNGKTEKIVEDFCVNASFLQDVTGKQVQTLSYPNGIWTPQVDDALRASGFIFTFTSENEYITNGHEPCGRFNRSYDQNAKFLIEQK